MIKPFQDNEGTSTIGHLVVENSTTILVISGSLEVTRDKVGQKHARALKDLAEAILEQLEAPDNLPDKTDPPRNAADHIDNPFR